MPGGDSDHVKRIAADQNRMSLIGLVYSTVFTAALGPSLQLESQVLLSSCDGRNARLCTATLLSG